MTEVIKVKYGVSKFQNINGITCYMNSILHILQQTPIFTEYISQSKFRVVIINKLDIAIEKKPDLTEHKVDMLNNLIIVELYKLFKQSLKGYNTMFSFKNWQFFKYNIKNCY